MPRRGEAVHGAGGSRSTLSTMPAANDPAPRRARTQGTFTWRMLATVLGGESVVIFFGALVNRGLHPDQAPVVAGVTPFVLMVVLAVAAIVVAGLMKRPAGPGLGLLIQVLVILSGVWLPMMVLVGIIFAVIYLYCLRVGVRIDRERAARAAATTDPED